MELLGRRAVAHGVRSGLTRDGAGGVDHLVTQEVCMPAQRTAPAASAAAASRPKRGKKYFSVDEANRALPYVARIVNDITEVYGRIVDLRRQLEKEPLQGVSQLEREYDEAMERLSSLIDELHVVGVELKDFERGLVDFPAIHDEREVLLCWKRGEEAVTHWHELDAGLAGRQPVTLLAA